MRKSMKTKGFRIHMLDGTSTAPKKQDGSPKYKREFRVKHNAEYMPSDVKY